eukprot:9430079-Pyramimonas_sp.AAC.1
MWPANELPQVCGACARLTLASCIFNGRRQTGPPPPTSPELSQGMASGRNGGQQDTLGFTLCARVVEPE